MEIKLTLALPRDHLSVPVVRRVLRNSMLALGIDESVTHDIELALTEACTNVLDHADEGNEYEVSAGIDGTACVIEVVDRGAGFDASQIGHDEAPQGAEEGRGIQLMRQLVDELSFTKSPGGGSIVHMEKQLVFRKGSPIDQLTEGHDRTEHGPWSEDNLEDEAVDQRVARR